MLTRKKKKSVTADLEKFLKDYNCDYSVEKEDNATIYNFEFQAARFVAAIRKQDDCVEVNFPTISSFPMGQLDLVRSKCNERNNGNILFKYSYTIDHTANKVDVHLSFFNNKFEPEDFAHELKAAFHFQREWYRDMDEAVAIARDNDTLDLESELYKHHREMFMLRRLELRHQLDSSAASIAVGTGALPLWQLLETVAPLPQSSLLFIMPLSRATASRPGWCGTMRCSTSTTSRDTTSSRACSPLPLLPRARMTTASTPA